MPSINPYLNFPGNTEDAFNFYKSVFGGEFAGGIMRYEGTPDGKKLSAEEKQKVMHVGLPIGGSMLMGTDTLESMGQKVVEGNNIHLSFQADNKEEADNIFNKLSKGGNIIMPMQDMFWGDYFGMLKDKFGIQWMVNYTNKN